MKYLRIFLLILIFCFLTQNKSHNRRSFHLEKFIKKKLRSKQYEGSSNKNMSRSRLSYKTHFNTKSEFLKDKIRTKDPEKIDEKLESDIDFEQLLKENESPEKLHEIDTHKYKGKGEKEEKEEKKENKEEAKPEEEKTSEDSPSKENENSEKNSKDESDNKEEDKKKETSKGEEKATKQEPSSDSKLNLDDDSSKKEDNIDKKNEGESDKKNEKENNADDSNASNPNLSSDFSSDASSIGKPTATAEIKGEKIPVTLLVNPDDYNSKLEKLKKKKDKEEAKIKEQEEKEAKRVPTKEEIDKKNTISMYSSNRPDEEASYFHKIDTKTFMKSDPNLLPDGRYMTPSLKSVWDHTCESQCSMCSGEICGMDCCSENKCKNGVCEFEDTILVPGCNDGEGPPVACARGRSNRKDYIDVEGHKVTTEEFGKITKKKDKDNSANKQNNQDKRPPAEKKQNMAKKPKPSPKSKPQPIQNPPQIQKKQNNTNTQNKLKSKSPMNMMPMPFIDPRYLAYLNRAYGYNNGISEGYYAAQLQMQNTLMKQMMLNNMILQDHMKKVEFEAATEFVKEQDEADKKKTLNGANGMHSMFMRLDNDDPDQDSKNVHVESTPRELQERVVPTNFDVPKEFIQDLNKKVKLERETKDIMEKDNSKMKKSKTSQTPKRVPLNGNHFHMKKKTI